MPDGEFSHLDVWTPAEVNKWVCNLCQDNKPHDRRAVQKHERTWSHQDAVKYHSRRQQHHRNGSMVPEAQSNSIIELRCLLDDMASTPNFEPGDSADNIDNYSVTKAMIVQGLRDFLDEDDLSDDQGAEISEDEEVFTGQTWHDDDNQAGDASIGTGSDRKCSRNQIVNEEWFPWPDKIVRSSINLPTVVDPVVFYQTCTLDILMHLPRSVFSERQIDILLWLLRVNNVVDVPSVKSVKLIKDTIQRLCGIHSIPYEGALGHRYYVNSLPDIIRQLCLKKMMNPRVRPLLHFYPEDTGVELNEARQAKCWLEELDPELLTPVVRLHNQDFFVFEPALLSSGQACIPFRWFIRGGKMYTKAWSLRPVTRELDCGWVVEYFHSFEVSEDNLLVSFRNWDSSKATSGLPRAYSIYGVERELNGKLQPWTLTNPSEGNQWRVRASDQLESVRFVVSRQVEITMLVKFRESWKQGIWAWDCVHEEYVLVIPSILALLGDNPMQMKGHDASVESNPARAAAAQPEDTDHSVGEIGEPRHKDETIAELKSMFIHASTVGNQTQIKQRKTSMGIKDTFLDSFLNRLAESYCKIRGGNKAKQEVLDRVKETLPENVISPVWRIKGIDPHTDTPVEILHTVLLGFVKYLWCDVVSVRIGKDKLKRELLETRLSSVDVSGLGLSHLAGHTLVQYAGSLVGRDFRAIAQVAPFVLHDLVPTECYDTWVALSNLIPLIWQPEIENSMEHLCNLTTSINNFLACTARWTPRWFNKPKFYVLLHVVDHIRRFGPAALFATEAFESFNAVIRAKTSNPSSDKPPDAINIKVVGKGPLSLVQRPNIITDYLGLDTHADTKKYGKVQFYMSSNFEKYNTKGHNFRTCKSMVLFNGDVCKIGDWVLVVDGTAEQSPIVACIREIIQRQGSDADNLLCPDAILLERGSVGEPAASYSMPAVRAHGGFLLYPVEHQCRVHKCMSLASDVEFVYEERAKTSKAKAVIHHIGDPHDLVLNTARMRDTKHMQGLRVPIQPQDMNLAILEGAAREIRTRNDTTGGASTTSIIAAAHGPHAKGRQVNRSLQQHRPSLLQYRLPPNILITTTKLKLYLEAILAAVPTTTKHPYYDNKTEIIP
ncbi:uncharacterized protein HD556DRAFT_1314704 [Suillus plorans]|uniref:Uncharacterized protein n=1 Tax=Suillus plorans TaxID=116603 RepID=A0A9P7A9D4_9AGAM|nr:uncharacterized protein HD556DRAFT_1314704 [Suillus plorans]KAG1784909.1 hypothetical protein HD556DRAFT_1314704 [Suillus plorans]